MADVYVWPIAARADLFRQVYTALIQGHGIHTPSAQLTNAAIEHTDEMIQVTGDILNGKL